MQVEQDGDPVARPGALQRRGDRSVIGPVILQDPRRDLLSVERPSPDLARTGHPARHQPEPAAQFGRGVGRGMSIGTRIDPRVAFMLGAVEIDPGARAALHQHRFVASCCQRQGIDMPILERL